MKYFHRAHATPEDVLHFAREFFGARGFAAGGEGDRASFTRAGGAIEVAVEIEGGHYTRVTASTNDVGESELDKVAKRFLSELHAKREPAHRVRGAY